MDNQEYKTLAIKTGANKCVFFDWCSNADESCGKYENYQPCIKLKEYKCTEYTESVEV